MNRDITKKSNSRSRKKKDTKNFESSDKLLYLYSFREVLYKQSKLNYMLSIKSSDVSDYKNIVEKFWDKENWNLVIVGEGGRGKTTCLFKIWGKIENNLLKSAIPVFIDVCTYNASKIKDNFILRSILKDYLLIENPDKTDLENLCDFLKNPVRRYPKKLPLVVLLIDNFDQITADNYGLVMEINKINRELKGVQVVLTARYDLRDGFNWSEFGKLEFFQLDDNYIDLYIEKKLKKTVGLNEKLKSVLANSMMLNLYANSYEFVEQHRNDENFICKTHPETSGEVMWNYIQFKIFQGSNEQNIDINRLVVMHLFAYAAYCMEKNNELYKTEKEFYALIQDRIKILQDETFHDVFKNYQICKTKFKKEKLKKAETALVDMGFIKIISGIVVFAHKCFRDYFASIHILNDIKMGIATKQIPLSLKERQFASSRSMRKFIGEIEGEHYNKPFMSETGWKVSGGGSESLTNMLDVIRGDFEGDIGYTVWNIIEILKEVRGSLASCDLSMLNLENVIINNISCSQVYEDKYCTADFNGSKLNQSNIFPQGHFDAVWSVKAGSGVVASCSGDKTVKIWDIDTNRCIKTLTGHLNWVNGIAIKDEKLISVSDDKTIKVWNINTGECIRTIEGHLSYVESVDADYEIIVTGSQDKTIKIWDMETGKCLKTLIGHENGVSDVILSGGMVISASKDSTIRLWDINSGECVKILEGHREVVGSLCMAENGKIISGSGDKTIKVWDMCTGTCLKTLTGHKDYVRKVKSLNGKIASASDDKTLKIWDLLSGQCTSTLKGHSCYVRGVDVVENKIVSCSDDKTIKVWDGISGKCIKTLKGCSDYVWGVAICKTYMASGSCDGTVKVWNLENDNCVKSLIGHKGDIRSLIIDKDTIISGSKDSTLKMWDINRGECINTLIGHQGIILGIQVSGNKIISASGDKTIRIWDWNSGKCLRAIEGHSGWVRSIAVSGEKVVSGSYDGMIKIWDMETGECLNTLTKKMIDINGVTIEGNKIIAGTDDGTIKIWDINTGQLLSTLAGHRYDVISITSCDGKIVAGAWDGTIKIWDMKTKSCIKTLIGHTGWVKSVAAGEGKIASGSYDGTIRVWDLNTGECLNILKDVPGVLIQGCDFRNLHPKSEFTNEGKQILRMYGVKI